jgi:hypothetical protein
MKYIFFSIIFFILTSYITEAQILKGSVTDQKGEPIPYATVYIQELKQGTTANTKGDFEFKLPPGKYLVICQSLGYEPVFVDITLTDQTITRDFILPEQYYEIPEVRITASGENPAYIIMRKAIGLAPYYLNHVSYYKADVYLKGNLTIKRIPKIMERAIKMEARSSSSGTSASTNTIKAGDSYFMESFNEIEFTAPDKYVQRVLSVNSTFPEGGNEISPMDYIQASLYQPVLADVAISPLSPEAFFHYDFRYLGASPQGNFIINKIEVIPKRKSQQLFKGTIYIIEDLWCLHSVDLTNENIIGTIRLQQLYIPVQEEIWMPVSHKFDINISIIGFKADVGYGSSVKYREVRPNEALQRPSSLTADYTRRYAAYDTTEEKPDEQIEKILQKEELSNRDMMRLSRLMKKQSEESIEDSISKNLEIKDNTTYIIEKDAAKKDSSYWTEIRPIPLSDVEIKNLRISDSTKALLEAKGRTATDTTGTAKKKSRAFTALRNIMFDHTWSDTTGFRFTNGGLVDLRNLSFNTVDGFVYGVDFRISKSCKGNRSLSLYPDVRWAFSREVLMWRINTNYNFNGMKQKQIFIRTGITSKDLNTGGGINPLLNTATSLLCKRNYLKLYESKYMIIGYRTEIVNGLTIELRAGYDDRRVLENTTDFSLIGSSREYYDNIPDNKYLEIGADPVFSLSDQKHGEFVTNITFTPKQRYRISNGNKIPAGSDWPTLSLTWKHGINEFEELADNIKHFDMIRFDVSKRTETGAFSQFRWRLSTGGFLDNTSLTYYDFFHFNAQPLLLLIDNYEDAFMLPEYYSLSTPEFFGELHLKYTTPYFLLKLLPGLSNTLMRENLSLSYLGSRYHKSYTEIGYSMSEVLLLIELGVYIGFDNFNYRSMGAKIVLRFN